MKKALIISVAVIVAVVFALYIFIPNVLVLKSGIAIKATAAGIYRTLLDKDKVAEWWPGKVTRDGFYFGNFTYRINNGNSTVLPVSVKGQNVDLLTSLFLISVKADSTQLQWVVSTPTSYNPVSRLNAYLEAKEINRGIDTILKKMENFYSTPENIYGFEIKKTLIVDSLLIATSGRCMGYPSNQFIYSLIDKLRKYALINAANESGYPMLNVATSDSIYFDVKVAIPTNKLLPSSQEIQQKRMPARFPILVTEVSGGIGTTTRAFVQIQKYLEDYQIKPAAIPFNSLVTDRLKEPDTSKWVTKIYFPVMLYPE